MAKSDNFDLNPKPDPVTKIRKAVVISIVGIIGIAVLFSIQEPSSDFQSAFRVQQANKSSQALHYSQGLSALVFDYSGPNSLRALPPELGLEILFSIPVTRKGYTDVGSTFFRS
jgi:hypothetical protein